MLVYNATDRTIVIVTDWTPDPKGGPAISNQTIILQPGNRIDLDIIGLKPAPGREGGER